MENTDTPSLMNFDNLTLSGGELVLAVARAYTGSFGTKPDLARLNLLLFLMEGDGEIRSELLFSNTAFGPKSKYLLDFIDKYPDLIRARSYGKKSKKRADPDVGKKVELTPAGVEIANSAIESLSQRELKTLSRILSKWGNEKHSEILTYVCMFFNDFCTAVERSGDTKPLS